MHYFLFVTSNTYVLLVQCHRVEMSAPPTRIGLCIRRIYIIRKSYKIVSLPIFSTYTFYTTQCCIADYGISGDSSTSEDIARRYKISALSNCYYCPVAARVVLCMDGEKAGSETKHNARKREYKRERQTENCTQQTDNYISAH